MQYDDTNRGALFRNDKKESDRHPDYKGPMNFKGEDGYLAAWLRETKDGRKYMSLSWEPKQQDPTGHSAARQDANAAAHPDPFNDEIPF